MKVVITLAPKGLAWTFTVEYPDGSTVTESTATVHGAALAAASSIQHKARADQASA